MSQIRKYRQKKSWTQKQLAEAAGVAEITVAKWEKGDRNPTLKRLKQLAEILGCRPRQLIE